MIDIGVNLADSAFDGDRAAVIDRALAAGLTRMIVTGTSVAQSRRALELARTRPDVLSCTAGVHPHDAKSCDGSTLDALRALAAAPEVVAIGETGLDYFRDLSPRPVQDRWFEAQLELAAALGLPAFVHERESSAGLLPILARWRDRLPGAVVHCFTGTAATLAAYLDLDLHIGITGWICDERRGAGLRELVGRIPDDRLLIETDAPYLIPRTLRPRPRTRRNEPMWLGEVRDAVAAARGQTPAEVAARSSANAARLFRLPA
jgi:TatD DNase family protein